jgi:hypothetical protein
MTTIAQFVQHAGIQCTQSATPEELSQFETASRLSLPAPVREFYAATNGCYIEQPAGVGMTILSLAEALKFVQGMENFGIPAQWGYFPFTDTNDSNPYCVCCNSPVQGWIAHVYHDDVAELQFRSIESFLTAITDVVRLARSDPEEFRLDELPHDFGPGKIGGDTPDIEARQTFREANDAETGMKLLDLARQTEKGAIERADALRWAITLLSENEVDEVIRLLDEEDEYCRNDARAKLEGMQSAKAREALGRDRAEMKDFLARCAEALRQAGLQVAVEKDAVRLDPGPVWLNMPMFFTNRRSPTFMADFVKRAKELLELNRQRKR